MGWENLHPTYMSQSQQTFETLTMFSTSCDDWIDIDHSHGQNSDATSETDIAVDQNLEGIHEDVWDLGVDSVPRSRTTRITA